MKIHFKPELVEVGRFEPLADQRTFSDEQPLFSASPNYARSVGGPLTRRLLDSWDWADEFYCNLAKFPVIDTRVQRLMPGMYPSIPGWHCDAVPRAHYDAQPDLSMVTPSVRHYTGLISTTPDVSNTEYVAEPMDIDIDPDSPIPVWQQVHRAVERERPRTVFIKPGIMYRFDQLTIHRASPTLKRGWRMFFRLSMYHKPPLNQKSGAMQVYLLSEENGW